jgi:hypothetical protein
MSIAASRHKSEYGSTHSAAAAAAVLLLLLLNINSSKNVRERGNGCCATMTTFYMRT